jgi:hypothetical protein
MRDIRGGIKKVTRQNDPPVRAYPARGARAGAGMWRPHQNGVKDGPALVR